MFVQNSWEQILIFIIYLDLPSNRIQWNCVTPFWTVGEIKYWYGHSGVILPRVFRAPKGKARFHMSGLNH